MALDPERRHLHVAEYENGTVDEVDLKSAKVVGRITDLKRPQGVAWLAAQGEIAVASEGGRVTFYRASDRREVAIVDLGDDADNVRIDRRNGHLLVGYGTGAIAIIDPTTHRVIGSVQLPAHPEAFEISASSVFVNVPDAHSLVIADQDHNRVISKNSTGLRFGNFPMVSDDTGHHIAIAFRKPPTVALLDVPWGDILWTSPVCGDADDLFFHASKIVVVCGSGAVDLLSAWVGSSRVDLQACKLEYSIVSPK